MKTKIKAVIGVGLAAICLILYLAEQKLSELVDEMFEDDLDWTP